MEASVALVMREESHDGCEGRSSINPEEGKCPSRNYVNHPALFILQLSADR